MSNTRLIPSLLALLTGMILATPSHAQIADQRFREYLVASLDDALSTLDEQTDAWKARYSELDDTNIVSELLGYQPPTFIVNIADVSSYLYTLTGDDSYARTTRDLLVSMNTYRRYFPEAFRTRVEYADGIPAVNWFRALPDYVAAFERTLPSGVYSESDIASVRDAVASSVDIIFKFPEWGAMNRAMLRAESLIAACLAFPNHERADAWCKMARILASDSIGKWEIEDASIYHPIWLHAYVNYLDLSGNRSAFASPMMKYYFDYFVALLTPAGTIPEFGDGWWEMNLHEYIVLLERGAAEYRSPEMKWAANRMMEHAEILARTPAGELAPGPALDEPSVGIAGMLIRRKEWSDADISPSKPRFLSGDVLDELIGKKIVLRSGWEDNDTYLMLNYKDEGYSSIMQKNYLKQVLAVEEEKMHHGQSDENGISLFMKNGSVLLTDGGYRPDAPSGPYGAYRADIFHNRVVVRDVRKGAGQSYFEILRNSGAYNDAVRTTKIDFQDFPDFEYARTRLDDPATGYTADRVLIRDKSEDFVIVVDAVLFRRPGYFTTASLWHTRQVIDRGDGWYRTRIDSLTGRYPNPGNTELLVVLPQEHDTGVEPEARNEQDELAIFEGASQYYPAGAVHSFVSVLAPIEPGEPSQNASSRFTIVKDDAEAVTVAVDGSTWYGVKMDLDRDVLTRDIRPRYDFASGQIDYGPFTTDADFAYVRMSGGTPQYAAINFVRMDVGGQTLFDAPSSQFFQVWGRSDHVGRAKWRRWDNFPVADDE